ncbi:uncharacterized protein [Dysidea avara]|uniref:uncharacterized protein isoform X2 n=1 Tax=Dysidea avara TaxID=196820 RepID=UPI00331E9786
MSIAGGDNLLLFVEAANILEQRRTSSSEPGDNVLNGSSQVGSRLLKGNKKRKLHKAQAPTTVNPLEVDAYAVDIKRVENPFAKDDSDSDSDDVSDHLKFHSTKSVSHAKMVHNAKEKKRRRSLKQAQLTLHQELQPYSHQKPVLRTILCTAIDEIKKLKSVAEENKSCLAALREEKHLLTEKLEFLKSLEQFPGDKERISSDNSYEDDETSPQQSMECDSVIDVTEDDSSEQYDEQDQSEEYEDKNSIGSKSNEEYVTTDGSQSSLFANPLFTSPLYYTAAAQLAALQAQSIQLAQLQTFTNPIWLPPFVWPNLNNLYSTVTGNQVNGTNSLYEKQHLQVMDGVNGHVRKEVGSESYCSAVKCSVVKTTGNVDKRNQSCVSPKSETTFCVDNLVDTL